MARTLSRLAQACFVAAAALCTAVGTSAQVPVNVVVILADDLGYGDLGLYGATRIATPAIDGLAADGGRFTSFYVHPVCSPTRAALLTGQFGARVGVPRALSVWSADGLDPSVDSLPDQLRLRGYRTGFFGKWHLGDSPQQLPPNQGFDDWFGSPWGFIGRPDILLDSNALPIWSEDLSDWTRQFTERTLEFIDESVLQNKPFFAVLAHHSPHWPVTPGAAFIGQSQDGREYGDAVEEIDAGVADIVARLTLHNQLQNTVVIFCSDNGPANTAGPYQSGSAGPLRGLKGSTFEGGVRVPAVIRWPQVIMPGSTIDEPVHIADIMPTLLNYIDGQSQVGVTYDGRDVRFALQGGGMPPGEDAVYFIGTDGLVHGVRRGCWKLRDGELYDLCNDIGEQVDLSAAEPILFTELENLRLALAADLAQNAIPALPTSRRRVTWRADTGLGPGPVVHGDLWPELEQGGLPWRVIDFESSLDFELVPEGNSNPSGASTLGLRMPESTNGLRLEREGAEFTGLADGPVSLVLWWRSDAPLGAGVVVLDIGDQDAGLSITVGDYGVLGDDVQAGAVDDVRVRVGGGTSPMSLTLDADLRDDASLSSVAFALDELGFGRLYIDAIEVASGAAEELTPGIPGPVQWGGDGDWCLLGRRGTIGGAAGPGALPPTSLKGGGEVAGLRLWDRALSRYEFEIDYSRYWSYRFCGDQMNSTGSIATLELQGSFHRPEGRLFGHVAGLPMGTFGVLVAGPIETRRERGIGGGYLCVRGARRYQVVGLPMNTTAAQFPVLASSGGPSAWVPMANTHWAVQMFYRDLGELRFTNALRVSFGN